MEAFSSQMPEMYSSIKVTYDVQKAVEATWKSRYFEFYRHAMFEVVKFIECEKIDQ